MVRYLTPSKISLLALISIYTGSVVPAQATVPILSFLAAQVLPLSNDLGHHSALSCGDTGLTLDALKDSLSSHTSGIPGRTVWDLLLNKLWEVSSLDALHIFFEQLSFLLPKQPKQIGESALHDDSSQRMQLSRTSPLGLFVRRAQLEFTRLQFHEGVALWQSFVRFRHSTLQQWEKRNPRPYTAGLDAGLELKSQDGNTPSLAHEYAYGQAETRILFSTEEVERLLEYQVNQIQKVGTRLPNQILSQLRIMLQNGIDTPSLSYYVHFLEAWKMGDYPSSFDSLHRYFDYTMHNKDRIFYQYALLNLAALHADFGASAEAMAAIQETISTAREHNDLGCLNYSLSWLYHFGKVHPSGLDKIKAKGVIGTDKEALNFLKVKSKEANTWCIFGSSLLGEVRHSLANGDSPSHCFESLLKASQVALTKNLSNTMGTQMALASTVFRRLGVNCQSSLLDEMFISCYGHKSPFEDQIQSICRTAFLLAQKGRYTDALRYMDQFDQQALRTLKYQRFWTAQIGILRLQRYLHCSMLDAAVQVANQLQCVKASGLDLSSSISFLEIDLYIRQEHYAKAFETLEKLTSSLDEGSFDIYLHIKTMILKASIYDKAGVPQKGFSVALRAAALAYNAKILPVLWEAIGALCAILHSLKEFEGSIQLLESIMPQVLEYEDCSMAARLYSLLADSHVGQAGKVREQTKRCKERLSGGLENLDKAFDEYSKIDDINGQCETLAKKATIMGLNGDTVLANDCAAQYLSIKKAATECG